MTPITRKPLSRRTVLRGLGVSLSLPFLDAMLPLGRAATRLLTPMQQSTGGVHPRIIFVYHPLGVHLPAWTPKGHGKSFELHGTLESLKPYQNKLSVISGLANPGSKGGHAVADTWLTGANLQSVAGKDYQNSVSIDQLIAEQIGVETRYPSLELSIHGGVGASGHSHTLAFDKVGTPIPTENNVRRLFDRLFTAPSGDSAQLIRRTYAERRSLLDNVLNEANELRSRLGAADRRKLDEYFDSVRYVEQRVQRLEGWVDRPRPKLDIDVRQVELEADPRSVHDREMWIDAMYELSYLAFATDSSRVITYSPATEAGGIGDNHHDYSHHGNDPGKIAELMKIDRFGVERFAHLLRLLDGTREGNGTMLDSTIVVYGSGAGRTHQAWNLPLIVAGGKNLGLKSGQHLTFNPEERRPMASLLLTFAQQLGLNLDSFADSKGTVTDLA